MPMFKLAKKRNINQFRMELARAHFIVALLSVAIIALLSLGASQEVTFDPTLSAICVVLLSLVTILSLCTAISLYRKK
jgi:peptidoglycan/LPS O-acetylase OafA/YrhL